ncbi:tyrosine-protein phosphatase [Neobacillus niacini]|uniref:tyrosine-protein phosphatase n=1 Tax=Neobacillus niacini TaxID=86668 RepID=UPI002FFF8507
MKNLELGHQRRRLVMNGTYNVRDIGGYPTREGRYTQWGKFFRSDSIHQLPEESRKLLLQQGIGLIIDLRFPHEGSYQFHQELGIKYINISLHNPANLRTERPKSLLDLYCNIIDTKQESIYQIFQAIIAEQGKAILFHCKSGKDRTGIIAALLLDLVGVQHEIIAEDYALSATYLMPLLEQRRSSLAALHGIKDTTLLESRPETMLFFLNYLHEKYENAEGYLKKIGISKNEIELLKKEIIEGPQQNVYGREKNEPY